MCTVTVRMHGHMRIITMNRDEHRKRRQEIPPAVWVGRTLTAPRDGSAGGTWIGLMPEGNWACMLNSYEPYTPPDTPPSRGEIIPKLLASTVPHAALDALDLTRYRPFTLLLGNRVDWHLFHWNGAVLTHQSPRPDVNYMRSSSSWNADSVLPERDAAFARWQTLGSPIDDHGIPHIHRWQEIGGEATGILMSRPESHTTSVTQIIIDDALPRMQYSPANTLTPIRFA